MKLKFLFFCLLILAAAGSVLLWRWPAAPRQNPIPAQTSPVPPQFEDKAQFLTAIKQSEASTSPAAVTGITIPHHLLAINLIADAFKFASGAQPKQIVLISPDHFNLGQRNITVSQNDFSTVFGVAKADKEIAAELLKLEEVDSQKFFYREHGLGAELPFIKYYFPEAKILAVTFKTSTPKAELDKVIAALEKNLGANSLVVQSTDFSHYLSALDAAKRDDQTLKILQSGQADDLFGLNQPSNLDCIACQYVQTKLQQEFFASRLKILAHKNSQDYAKEDLSSTTSYIVQGYIKDNK